MIYNADAGGSPHLHRALREIRVCQPVNESLKDKKHDAYNQIHQRPNQNFRPRDFVVLVDFRFALEVTPVVHSLTPLAWD